MFWEDVTSDAVLDFVFSIPRYSKVLKFLAKLLKCKTRQTQKKKFKNIQEATKELFEKLQERLRIFNAELESLSFKRTVVHTFAYNSTIDVDTEDESKEVLRHYVDIANTTRKSIEIKEFERVLGVLRDKLKRKKYYPFWICLRALRHGKDKYGIRS